MKKSFEPYGSAPAVDAAIKEAAGRAVRVDPSIPKSMRIEMELFNRFLSRIFAAGEESGWVLKGGTGVLARVPTARATRDIDLHSSGSSLEEAVKHLRASVETDLGDFFRFVYKTHVHSLGGEAHPDAGGVRVEFEKYLGAVHKGTLSVDIVIGREIYGPTSVVVPTSALDLPRLVSYPYIVYPVVGQIAEKVAATMQTYGGRPSSREKDLVDLVILATTQDVEGRLLMQALALEMRRRSLPSFAGFSVPSHWGRAYRNLASRVPHCAQYLHVDAAVALLSTLVNPALSGEVEEMTWCSKSLSWRPS